MAEKANVGDEVRADGRSGTVKKVKPDGTRVVRTSSGTLREDADPKKPAKLDADKDDEED